MQSLHAAGASVQLLFSCNVWGCILMFLWVSCQLNGRHNCTFAPRHTGSTFPVLLTVFTAQATSSGWAVASTIVGAQWWYYLGLADAAHLSLHSLHFTILSSRVRLCIWLCVKALLRLCCWHLLPTSVFRTNSQPWSWLERFTAESELRLCWLRACEETGLLCMEAIWMQQMTAWSSGTYEPFSCRVYRLEPSRLQTSYLRLASAGLWTSGLLELLGSVFLA